MRPGTVWTQKSPLSLGTSVTVGHTPQRPQEVPRPWSHPAPLDQPLTCMSDDLRLHLARSERGPRDHVSRNPGDTWVARSRRVGPAGREDRARNPLHAVHAPAPEGMA